MDEGGSRYKHPKDEEVKKISTKPLIRRNRDDLLPSARFQEDGCSVDSGIAILVLI